MLDLIVDLTNMTPVSEDADDLVDRPTQLIYISDICRQTNTKDIAGQSATDDPDG